MKTILSRNLLAVLVTGFIAVASAPTSYAQTGSGTGMQNSKPTGNPMQDRTPDTSSASGANGAIGAAGGAKNGVAGNGGAASMHKHMKKASPATAASGNGQ